MTIGSVAKKLVLTLAAASTLTLATPSASEAGHRNGGAFVGGLFTGLLLGGIAAHASRPHYSHSPSYYYYNDDYYYYQRPQRAYRYYDDNPGWHRHRDNNHSWNRRHGDDRRRGCVWGGGSEENGGKGWKC